ncbi:uncharacterized protein L203_102846 [Cryptococcus depauperatus CBS 7841]|uniref:EGF-like domain-containing protein n=1 Tax=Cryptococcus depauperatus CBS 7841 TaxID=1295531 RepID=A0AAJ8M1H3_9TREE
MITRTYITAVKLALAITSVFAENRVCSPTACLEGKTSSSLLAFDSSTSTYLLPGTYQSDLYSPSGLINATISNTSSSLLISGPEYPVGFVEPGYGGTGDVRTTNSHTNIDWRSVYLPDTWYATLGEGKVLWGAIPDRLSLPRGVSGLRIRYTTSSACSPICSSHGECISTNSSMSCQCEEGWEGASCNQCSPGYFGTSCKSCPSNCTVCDDGFFGTGYCLGTATNSSKTCNCDHGTCTPTNGSAFKDFSRTLWATVELAHLSISTANPSTCVFPSGSCEPGPATSQCLTCAPPRVRLQGDCVGYKVGTGQCDSSLSELDGVFVVNNEKDSCDACPHAKRDISCKMDNVSRPARMGGSYPKGQLSSTELVQNVILSAQLASDFQ